jgi:hypothetical protein
MTHLVLERNGATRLVNDEWPEDAEFSDEELSNETCRPRRGHIYVKVANGRGIYRIVAFNHETHTRTGHLVYSEGPE